MKPFNVLFQIARRFKWMWCSWIERLQPQCWMHQQPRQFFVWMQSRIFRSIPQRPFPVRPSVQFVYAKLLQQSWRMSNWKRQKNLLVKNSIVRKFFKGREFIQTIYLYSFQLPRKLQRTDVRTRRRSLGRGHRCISSRFYYYRLDLGVVVYVESPLASKPGENGWSQCLHGTAEDNAIPSNYAGPHSMGAICRSYGVRSQSLCGKSTKMKILFTFYFLLHHDWWTHWLVGNQHTDTNASSLLLSNPFDLAIQPSSFAGSPDVASSADPSPK